MAEEKEKFLSRWSRLKNESKDLPQKSEEAPAPILPSLDTLTSESDFSGFMHPKVDAALRRAALKKLFSDPHFNVPDPYEAYSGDWTVGEPIPEEMLATLNQARTLLFGQDEKKKDDPQVAEKPDGVTAPGDKPENDDGGRKDA